jgi:hypothetical protein
VPYDLPARQGNTDSEVLCLALDRVRDDLCAVCGVLSAMRGLAALAWVDRARPHLVFLARAALCPLTVARDGSGNLYWASSPTWFRLLEERSGGRLDLRVERVQEGVLLAVAAGELPAVATERSFTPVARAMRAGSRRSGLAWTPAMSPRSEPKPATAPPTSPSAQRQPPLPDHTRRTDPTMSKAESIDLEPEAGGHPAKLVNAAAEYVRAANHVTFDGRPGARPAVRRQRLRRHGRAGPAL